VAGEDYALARARAWAARGRARGATFPALASGASILGAPGALGSAFGVGKTIKDLTKLAADALLASPSAIH
jgi:hypothetical protein